MTTKSLPLLLVVILCIAVTIFIFQPGYLNADAVDQLGQARSGQYSDWHPPVMSWVWSLLDKVAPGALGMFLLQIILFWSGLGLLAAFVTHKPFNQILIVLLGFFPPLFMLLSAVIKDILMAASFLFGFALLVWCGRKRSWLLFALGLVFITFAMLTRHNAILIAGPMFLYAGFIFIDLTSLKTPRLSPFWAGSIAGTLFFAAAFLLGNMWVGSITKINLYPVQQIMVHDLTGISLRLKTDFLPDYLAISEQPSMKDLRRIYNVRSLKNLYYPDFTKIHFRVLSEPELVDDLTSTWLRVIREHPRAYVEHRWNVLMAIMSISVPKSCGPYYYETTIYKPKGYYGNNGGYYSDNPIVDQLFSRMELLRNSILYQNWLYVLFSICTVALSLFAILFKPLKNKSLLYIALLLGGGALMYAAANLFIGVSCDFRYYYWNAATSLIGGVFIFLSEQKN